jgi:hypothetical protein
MRESMSFRPTRASKRAVPASTRSWIAWRKQSLERGVSFMVAASWSKTCSTVGRIHR